MKQKLTLAASLVAVILAADIVTKRWALATLDHGRTVEIFAGVPFTLAYNTGIAFGIGVPEAARWLLVAASVFVVVLLAGMFLRAEQGDVFRISAIALVTAGALGNLIDRVRWEQGVIDFIGPFNLGLMHWPIFNIADMAITTGAVALGVSLWREDARERRLAARPPAEPAAEPGE